jgi:hypothetical protein
MARLFRGRMRLTLLVWGIIGGSIGVGTAALARWTHPWGVASGEAVLLGAALGVLLRLEVDGNLRLRRLGRDLRETDRILTALTAQPTWEQIDSPVRRIVADAENRLRKDVEVARNAFRNDTRQLEALLNLHAMVPVRRALPFSRGWAASPDLLLSYVDGILERRPSLVVECGSGLSTLWAALALESLGGQGKVVALEHNPSYREDTLAALEKHGVSHRAEVRLAPIETTVIDGQPWPWYDTQALNGLSGIGVLFVDGPIGALGPQSRYPALPLLRDALAPGALILLDDADRPEEREVLAHWRTDWPELAGEELTFEKGAARLLVPAGTGTLRVLPEEGRKARLASVTIPDDDGSIILR